MHHVGSDDGDIGVDDSGSSLGFLLFNQVSYCFSMATRQGRQSVVRYPGQRTAAPRLLRSARTCESCKLSMMVVDWGGGVDWQDTGQSS